MMVEGPLASLPQRRDKPTYYLPDALPQPVWASAPSQSSVKKRFDGNYGAVKGMDGQSPCPEGNSSASPSGTPSGSRTASSASESATVHQLQSSHASRVSDVASVEGSGEALPAPVSVPSARPDFEDVVSNGEYSDFQDAHSEASSPSSSQEDKSVMEDGMRKLSLGQEHKSSSSSSASSYWVDKLQDEHSKRLEAECAAAELGRRCAHLQMQLQLEQQAHRQACTARDAFPVPSNARKEPAEVVVARLVAAIIARAVAQDREAGAWRTEVELLQRRVSRMVRMEEAIKRQRAAERTQRDTMQRRLLNYALAAGCVGAGALAAYLAVCWLQSSGRAAEVGSVQGAACSQHRGAGQPGMGTDAAGLDAELLHSADASTSSSNTWAAVGHLGAPVSTMGSAAVLSTAEILQCVAEQQAGVAHAPGEAGSAAFRRQEAPGVAARSGDTRFSAALPSGLETAGFLGAASVRERSAWGPFAVLMRLNGALRLSHS